MKTKIFFEPICKANLKHKGQKNIPQPSKRTNEKALYLEKPKLVQGKPRYTFSHCFFQGSSNVIFFSLRFAVNFSEVIVPVVRMIAAMLTLLMCP